MIADTAPRQRPRRSTIQQPAHLAARNLAFSTLVFGERFRAFAARSTSHIFWSVGAFTNLRLFAVVVISALAQVAIHTFPLTQALFQISALSSTQWALAVGIGLVPVTVLELEKLVRAARRRTSGSNPS